jgi:hypothetical protein
MKKLRFEYDYIMATDHVNSCHNLVALLKYYFPIHSAHWCQLSFNSINFNFFFSFNAKVKKEFLKNFFSKNKSNEIE